MIRTVAPDDMTPALKAVMDEFFQAVSFDTGQTPAYATIHDLFIDDGKLIRNSGEVPEISSVDEFIASREQAFGSGALTSFEEVEIAERTEVFGSVAHRLSTYTKRGTMDGEAIEGAGVISTQLVRTPAGWKISSMAWDDERPGLDIPARYK